ncbi:MAG TPA: hypothetical protein VJM31_15055 [Vicinamibacterales bacterium]|nr:hypothetical protein [Vicinamibacterales bacterium]
MSSKTYEEQSIAAARAAIEKGWRDPVALRELLIWTTAKTTIQLVEDYLAEHRHEAALLEALLTIAEEGEDCGDAPWAAANQLEEFSPEMLQPHASRLEVLSQHPWMYLADPAVRALHKVRARAV